MIQNLPNSCPAWEEFALRWRWFFGPKCEYTSEEAIKEDRDGNELARKELRVFLARLIDQHDIPHDRIHFLLSVLRRMGEGS